MSSEIYKESAGRFDGFFCILISCENNFKESQLRLMNSSKPAKQPFIKTKKSELCITNVSIPTFT